MSAGIRTVLDPEVERGARCYHGVARGCLSIRCGSDCSDRFDRMHPCPACLIAEIHDLREAVGNRAEYHERCHNQADLDQAAVDERARIVWWLRQCASGPAAANASAQYLLCMTELADVIDRHPDRFAEAPTGRKP